MPSQQLKRKTRGKHVKKQFTLKKYGKLENFLH